MGSLFSSPSPPPPPVYTPPAPVEDPAEAAAREARIRQRRGNIGTVATSWHGLEQVDQSGAPKRKSLLGE